MTTQSSIVNSDRVQVLDVRVMAGRGGGPEKTILRSPRYLRDTRYEMTTAYIHPVGDSGITALQQQAAALDCPLHAIAESSALDRRTPAALLKLCRDRGVTIWHGHDYKSDLLGLLLRRFHPMKLVTTLHGWSDETLRIRLYRRLDEWAIRRYDHVFAVSSPIAQRCDELGVPSERLTLLPNGVDLDEFARRQDISAAKRSLDIKPGRRVIGVVGRLSHEKGVDRLIKPLAELAARMPEVLLLIVGDGPELSRLDMAVTAANLGEHVRFCGWQSPLQTWMEAMDALVLPSRTEGVPNALLEAMAMGTPVAATDVGGVSDVLDGGRCGVLLGDDPATWTDALERLLREPVTARDMAASAHQRVSESYSFAQRMRRLVDVYDRLLESADKDGVNLPRAA